MDGAAFLDRIRADNETALERLGSEKALLAATEARLEADAILVTAAATLAATAETLEEWAASADGAAGETLAATADSLDDARERVTAELDDGETTEPAAIDAVDVPFVSLSAEGDVERVAAGTVAVGLVLDRLFLQSVSFFVNEAQNSRADLFRDLRDDADRLVATGQETLDELCADDADWDRAETAVSGTIQDAYDDYASRLDAMGFDPKPIC
jgi:hypothetical protein